MLKRLRWNLINCGGNIDDENKVQIPLTLL